MNKRDDAASGNRERKKWTWLRRVLRVVGVLVVLVVVVCLCWLRGALCNRFIRFPRQEAAWQAIRAQRQPVADHTGWTEYRGNFEGVAGEQYPAFSGIETLSTAAPSR